MSTAHLTKIIRQKDAPDLKHVVELFYEGRIHEGVDILKKLDCIKEVKSERQRYEAIAKEFMEERDHTLVISPDNRSRAGINAVIHRHLQEAGRLDKAETTIQVLVSRQDISGAERGWAKRYEVGNVLRYERPSKVFGFEQGEYATVTAIDARQNAITVARSNGETVTYNPERFCGPSSVSLYRPDEKSFSVGELIQFTSNSKDLGISNRDRAVVTGFTEDGKVTAALYEGADKPAGRSLTIDPKQFAHLDHAYAVTSYSSQGLTERADILNIDTNNMNPQLINDRLAYVAASRMKVKLTIYCNDANQLADALARDISKTSAIRPPAEIQSEPSDRPNLANAVDLLSKGDTANGIARLKDLGYVVEIKDDAERHRAMAQEYVAAERRAVLVSPDNFARAAVNDAVHAELKAGAKLEKAEVTIPVLIRRQDIADEQRKNAEAYRPGDVIRYDDQPRNNLPKLALADREYGTVTATDPENNSITVQRANGHSATYKPENRPRVSVYRRVEKTFSVGETVRFTSDYAQLRIRRDDRAKVLEVTPDGKLSLRLIPPEGKKHKARTIQLDPAQCPHLDHTYAAATTFGAKPRAKALTLIQLDGDTRHLDAIAKRLALAAETNRDPRLKIYCKDTRDLAVSLSRGLAEAARSKAQQQLEQKFSPASRDQQQSPRAVEISAVPEQRSTSLAADHAPARPAPPTEIHSASHREHEHPPAQTLRPPEHELAPNHPAQHSSIERGVSRSPAQPPQLTRSPQPVQHQPESQAHDPGHRPAAPERSTSQVRQPETSHQQIPAGQQKQPAIAPTGNAPAHTPKPPQAKQIEQEIQQDTGLSL
jgi:hypothetical protein